MNKVKDYTAQGAVSPTAMPASAGVRLYQDAQALEQMSRTDSDRRQNAAQIKSMTKNLSDQRYVMGFGSFGGEEFLVLLPGADIDAALARANAVLDAVRAMHVDIPNGAPLQNVTASIGLSVTPLHVPKKIIQVEDIPRTISGKISELAVREVIHGRPVKNTEALANPQSLSLYERLPQLRD